MPAGRPTDYTDDLADLICERLANGESMRSVCRDEATPAMTTVFRWLRENEEFRQQYEVAKEECADALVEDMLDIADNQASDIVMVDGIPLQVKGELIRSVSSASVGHARLRVDTRKWAASKLKPKKYGEKIQQEVTGAGGGPIKTASTISFVPVGSND